jgi:hypothetical protein
MVLLIDYLHSIGNFGQHMNDISQEQERPVDHMFCITACLIATTLLERMADDLR